VLPRAKAKAAMQLLNPAQVRDSNSHRSHRRRLTNLANHPLNQEAALVDWVNHLGMLAQPLSAKTIGPYVQDLCGRKPGGGWLKRFLVRNRDRIKYCRTSALDPKRARSFNYPVVKDYFDKLDDVIKKHDIPVENIYNMDEKGCQLGGGRKQGRRKYLFGKGSRGRYRIRDANLELATVVECVCADGTALKPYIIFKGKRIQRDWFQAKGIERTAA